MLALDNIYNGDCLELMKEIPDKSVEIWHTIRADNHYEVSNKGNVRRKAFIIKLRNGGLRKYKAQACKPIRGTSTIMVSINGKRKGIAQLVAEAFISSYKTRMMVYHLNKDIWDNRLENLSLTNQKILFDEDSDLTEREYLMKYYNISRDGVVVRKRDGRVLSSTNGPKGYLCIRLKSPKFSKNKDRRKTYKIHRLVAMYYLPDYNESLQVNHKNGVKTDNRVENLEMVTNQENAIHAWRVLDSIKRRELLENRRRADGTFGDTQKNNNSVRRTEYGQQLKLDIF